MIPQYGVVSGNLFIQAGSTGGWVDPANGDNRGFASGTDCSQSRVCFILNFQTGEGYIQYNYSCRPGHQDCVSALPLGKGNSYSVSVEPGTPSCKCAETVALHIDAHVSLPPNVPVPTEHIVQDVTIGAAGPTAYPIPEDTSTATIQYLAAQNNLTRGVTVTGTNFPALEVFRSYGDITQTLIQQPEDAPFLGVPPLNLDFLNFPLSYRDAVAQF